MNSRGKKGNVVPLKGRLCPLCGSPAAADHLPFCSRRCADLDLSKWLKGDYRFESDEEPELNESPPEDD